MIIKGNILNVFTDEIYPAEIKIEHGIIQSIKEVNKFFSDIIVPGFIDSHIHIESTQLTPSRFAEIALRHGTTSAIIDPQKIANVMGINGIEYLIRDAKYSPLNYYFTAPPCIKANEFETNGATLKTSDVEYLLKRKEFVALGEVKDKKGVIEKDNDIISKIKLAHKFKKPIDGKCDNLKDYDLQQYARWGISTDHECRSRRDVEEIKRVGIKAMITEGSYTKTLEEFVHSECDFMVSDTINSEDLIDGHINLMLRKAVDLGMDPFDAIKLVTINPAQHYNINAGCIAPGRKADLVFIDNLSNFNVKRVIINGNTIFKKQKLLYRANPKEMENTINIKQMKPDEFNVKVKDPAQKSAVVNVIKIRNADKYTTKTTAKLNVEKSNIIPSVFEDILKVSVIDRYGQNTIANGFIKGFGIKNGAIATSVSCDCNNIVAVGTNSDYMADAVNKLHENKGGFVAVSNKETVDFPLAIAGLMSMDPASKVAKKSEHIHDFIKSMGCKLQNVFTTLSNITNVDFAEYNMTNMGLFDVKAGKLIDIVK